MELVKYEAARSALAEAYRVDEVKDIRDKAEAMAAYARQAKDRELIQYATEIKVRAERRCGEMLRDTAERGERATPHGNVNPKTKVSNDATPTLADMGLTRDESSRYQQLASMSEAHFEAAVETAKNTAGEVTTAFMLREARRGKPKKSKAAKRAREQLKSAPHSTLAAYARQLIAALREAGEISNDEREVLAELLAVLRPIFSN